MTSPKTIVCFLFLLIFQSGYSQFSLSKLESQTDFIKFSGPPLTDKYGQVKSVKVVYDIKNQKMYYVNSKYFRYHLDFCNSQISPESDGVIFNRLNYGIDPDRDYLLGNLNYYQSTKRYILELSSFDLMSLENVVKLYQLVVQSSFCGDQLYFLMSTTRFQRNKSILEQQIRVISPAEVYAGLNYQGIGKYEGEGTLKFISEFNLGKNEIGPKDIIVIDTTPVYLPTVAGIIITEFQTPLSHLTILGQNRKIPICAYKLAFNDSALRKYEGQFIQLNVTADTFTISKISTSKLKKKRKTTIKLNADLKLDSLLDVKDIKKGTVHSIGNKAYNFGTLYKISKRASFRVPEGGFAIPFYFYQQHLLASGAKLMIDELLNDCQAICNQDSLKSTLKKIRKVIERAPVDPLLLQKVEAKIKLSGFDRMRFRSSTNAEDATGFSGAGLYKSKTGILNSEEKPIDKAIKDVWASLWSYEAFTERQYYNIDQHNCYMGVLVHRGFPDEELNGVAITKNPYRINTEGYLINVQLGDEAVVNPTEGVVCDQFICYPSNSEPQFENENPIEIISLSSLGNGELLMTDEEILFLANQLRIIKDYYLAYDYYFYIDLNLGLDIEFKLDGENRLLYIKQVRLYND